MKPFEIIQKLESDNSRLFKEQVITDNLSHTEFVQGCKLALDSYTTFGIKQIPISETDGPGLSYEQFEAIAKKFINRTSTGNAAKELIDFLISLATADEWNFWYRRILMKDLKCGVSEKTLTKCGIDIPKFQCMLASNGENNKHMTGDCYIEYKYDGVRALVIVKNNTATIYSRNGKQLTNFPHIEEAFSKPEFNEFVFDGEVMSKDFQSLMRQVHRKEGAKTDDAYLALFDMLTITEFQNGRSAVGLTERKKGLENLNFDPCVQVVGYDRCNLDTEQGQQKFKELNKHAIDNGMEGIMVKPVNGLYECKRSNAWFKIKPYIEVTLMVEAIEEGQGKFINTTGALVCEGIDYDVPIKVNVGSGLTDELRDTIWANQEDVLHQMVEIKADSISQNQDGTYSLRFPRFKTFRGFEPGEKL